MPTPQDPSNNNAADQHADNAADATIDREEHIQRVLKEFEKKLREQMPDVDEVMSLTLDEIEETAERLGKEIQQQIQKEMLDMRGSGYIGRGALCSCGGSARFVALRKKQILTRCAGATLYRAYYHCRACKRGFCPLDGQLGIGRGSCSAGVRALLGRFASYLPYRTAAAEMEAICGISVSAGTARSEAQSLGRTLERDFAQQERRVQSGRATVPAHRPSSLHLSMDGVLIHAGGEWREVKCAVAYESGKDEEGQASGVERALYYATLARSSAFGKRVRTLAFNAGSGRCSRIGVVADGAPWIWQETGKHFCQSTQILDFYHACEHLWQLARLQFGEGDPKAKEWMRLQKAHLLADEVESVQAAVERCLPTTKEGRDVKRKVAAYLATHAHRMRYGTLRSAGWHIGSGVMEGACKSVVQGRMKGVGMRWGQSGAEAMLHLRSAWCSHEHAQIADAARRSVRAS